MFGLSHVDNSLEFVLVTLGKWYRPLCTFPLADLAASKSLSVAVVVMLVVQLTTMATMLTSTETRF